MTDARTSKLGSGGGAMVSDSDCELMVDCEVAAVAWEDEGDSVGAVSWVITRPAEAEPVALVALVFPFLTGALMSCD